MERARFNWNRGNRSTTRISLGNDTGGNVLKGAGCDFAIWNVALSGANITALQTTRASGVASGNLVVSFTGQLQASRPSLIKFQVITA